MYKLQILQKAREDMQNSAKWYNQQQTGLGEKFIIQVINSFHSIEANPLHYEEKFRKNLGLH